MAQHSRRCGGRSVGKMLRRPSSAAWLYLPVNLFRAAMSDRFQLVSPYSPAGDQPAAIEKLVANFDAGIAKLEG